MKKRMIFTIALTVILLLSLHAFPQLKKRVAVFSFEDKSKQGWHWWDGGSPGDGVADMLTTELVKSGKYIVIERQEIAKIMQEQDFGMYGRVTEQSAAKIGKLLGVELAVIGAVTEFGQAKGGTGGRIKGIGVGVSKQKATVAIDVRFVNTTTGEIIAADNIRKEESKSGITLSTPEFGFDNRNDFDNSLAGKATREAVESIMALLEDQMESMPWSGKIIKVSGSTIYMKPGSGAGVKVGDVFTVYSLGEELIDPDTGLSLGSEEKKIGTIKVTSLVGDAAAKATVVSGSGFKESDPIRKD